MSDRSTKRESGFSLLEMVISMALGTVVLGAAVQIYSQGVAATWTITQRAEMQQDFRAASNLLTKDLSQAGAGLGDGAAIQLPTSATSPVYGCDPTKCYLGASNTVSKNYPTQGTTPYLYGLIPGYTAGPTISTLATDTVTVVYTDIAFNLSCYQAGVTNATTVTFTLTPASLANCGIAAPQNVNDAAVGLTAGDLVWFNFSPNVVAEVTGTVTAGTNALGQPTYTVPFAPGAADPLLMNQATATNSLAKTPVNTTATATRILVVTYYLDATVKPQRLMRQVSGHSPMPVAENIVYMKFSYDLYNPSTTPGTVATNQPNPGSGDANDLASNGLLPNQITKINILHMAIDSTMHGTQGYQGLDLETSVSARDLTYNNNYPLPPSSN